jgi:hypothetical protein
MDLLVFAVCIPNRTGHHRSVVKLPSYEHRAANLAQIWVSSSPRIPSIPQVRISLAICLISDTMLSVNGGLPRLHGLDLRLHTQRNSSRCQRKSVSRWTITSACFHALNLLANNTSRVRSRQVSAGRFTCRFSTMSCWRRSMFPNISSLLLRVTSRGVFRIRAWLSGFVHWRRRCLARQQRESIRCRTKENGEGFMACLSRWRCRQ